MEEGEEKNGGESIVKKKGSSDVNGTREDSVSMYMK